MATLTSTGSPPYINPNNYYAINPYYPLNPHNPTWNPSYKYRYLPYYTIPYPQIHTIPCPQCIPVPYLTADPDYGDDWDPGHCCNTVVSTHCHGGGGRRKGRRVGGMCNPWMGLWGDPWGWE
jgi:hypothetical protein